MMPIAVNPLYDGKRLLEIRDRFLVLAEEIKRGRQDALAVARAIFVGE